MPQTTLKISSTHQLLVYADGNILGGRIRTIKKTESLVAASKEFGLEVNADMVMDMVMY